MSTKLLFRSMLKCFRVQVPELVRENEEEADRCLSRTVENVTTFLFEVFGGLLPLAAGLALTCVRTNSSGEFMLLLFCS